MILPLALVFSACSGPCFRVSENGLLIRPDKKKTATGSLYLQVVNDDIIRVIASPDRRISLKTGLMCSWQDKEHKIASQWQVYRSADSVVLETATIRATALLNSGELIFSDLNGSVFLREQVGGGKSFSPVDYEGSRAYSFRQVFESPQDEAFFGLGQHQSDEFNYKNKHESLYQYNTKVSVPFVVSSKNYGLLWDNNSYSKWGDPREFANLDQFRLYDKYGKEGGLTACYSNPGRKKELERIEKTIDYQDLNSQQDFPQAFPLQNARVSWEGSIESDTAGLFRFALYYAGYVKLYLDDTLVVPERWRTAWNPNTCKFSYPLQAGQKHRLRLEWQADGGSSYIGLKALSPLPGEEEGKISFWSEMGKQMDYYVIRGKNADDVVSGYRRLTGKAQVMPRWAMGFWQSRERYKTQNEILSVLREFRHRQIPIDNIVQDWSYWEENAWGSHEFDAQRFPDPEQMVRDVHDLNARIMISVWPKFYINTEHYEEFEQKGWIYPRAVQDSIRDWIGRGYIGSFYDAFSPGARDLFWEQMQEHLYVKGFDAWWMDASEPDILSNADMDYRKQLMHPTALGPSALNFNAYGLMNAKGIYEGQRSVNDSNRVFILTRSGYAGSQRYAAAVWSGDIGTRWEDMKAQISAGQNFSISGNPYWTMDNGGFCVEKRYEKAREGSEDLEEWRELNVRWHQFGAFVPLFRSHGQYPYREIWHIAPEEHPAYQAMKYYTELRYRLLPYIYTMAGRCYLDDYTIMRPLMMDFANDARVMDIGDQYMFGSDMMVCPVYEYQARSRQVYFPQNAGWYDLYQGNYYPGGQESPVDAPYERMPVFVPAGSILPTGKLIQHSSIPQHDLCLYIYAGGDASCSIYEDEGCNYNYEKGQYSRIEFNYKDNEGILHISRLKGSYPGQVLKRNFDVVLINRDSAGGLDVQCKHLRTVEYRGLDIEIKL
ncbi:MAG: glycoside hydrolase family 31 protein [Bacteroidales bacterium]|nr:glycoside hydrolase family 31 protein [Bacteroidales bacterium]